MCQGKQPSRANRHVNTSAKAALNEGTILAALARFPLLFFQWPYLGGVLFFASILLANIFLGDLCDARGSEFISPAGGSELSTSHSILAEAVSTLQSNLQDTLICGTHTRDFSLGTTERKVLFLLAAIGVVGSVIPGYIQKKVAQRHVSQRTANRALLFHIAAGIVTVLGNGLIGILYGGFSGPVHSGALFCFLAGTDLFHQLSVLLLIKNHDGIYALRVGNLASALFKFVTLVNHSRHVAPSDVFFAASFGFLGTRIAAVGFMVATYFAKGKNGEGLQNEDWYSIGTAVAQLGFMLRAPGFERMFLCVSPLSAYLFYHELWDKSEKMQFVAWNVIYSGVCLMCLNAPSAFYIAIVVYYYVAGFNKKRFYRWPENAFKGAKKEEVSKIDRRRAMSRLNSTWITSFKN